MGAANNHLAPAAPANSQTSVRPAATGQPATCSYKAANITRGILVFMLSYYYFLLQIENVNKQDISSSHSPVF